jgi:RHS repeat-associated protein
LITAQGSWTHTYSKTYGYDTLGNIILNGDFQPQNYIYAYDNKPHAVRSVSNNMSFQYDANGNMTRKVVGSDVFDITWTPYNKPWLVQKNGSGWVSYEYDGNGQRATKYPMGNAQRKYYWGKLYESSWPVNTIHIFANNQHIASFRSDGVEQYYHPNHLGSASIITDVTGAEKQKIEYFPFGTKRTVPSPHEQTGTYDYDGSFPNVNYTFTDQEEDDETGFYNFKARLYDPVIGRFISPDTIVPNPGDSQSLNRYSYVLNNPLKYTDPSGYFFDCLYGIPNYDQLLVAGSAASALSVDSKAAIITDSDVRILRDLSGGISTAQTVVSTVQFGAEITAAVTQGTPVGAGAALVFGGATLFNAGLGGVGLGISVIRLSEDPNYRLLEFSKDVGLYIGTFAGGFLGGKVGKLLGKDFETGFYLSGKALSENLSKLNDLYQTLEYAVSPSPSVNSAVVPPPTFDLPTNPGTSTVPDAGSLPPDNPDISEVWGAFSYP